MTGRPACPACGDGAARVRGPRVQCAACGTIRVPARTGFVYDDLYPDQRGHALDHVARCKQITLLAWLDHLRTPLAGRAVLEIGFGGGATLTTVARQGGVAHGVEPVARNRAAAIGRGIPADRVFADLRDIGAQAFDLVLYLDSFEHLPDPAQHLRTLAALTRPGSRALVVLPIADSVSRKLLGRWWPHDLPDHWVFYSRAGLATLWGTWGWDLVDSFYPWKYLSLHTVARHWQMKTGMACPGWDARAGIWLNFGEAGLIFERR